MDIKTDSLADDGKANASEARQTGHFLCLTVFVALGAAALSVVLNSLIDFGLLGGAAWLQEKHVRFLIGYEVHEEALGVFVHALILEISYLAALALSIVSKAGRLINGRGLSFVFLSFLFYEVWVLLFYPVWWARLGWISRDYGFMCMLAVLPVPGALNYALRLLVAYSVARARQLQAFAALPWWSIFAPTASFAIALVPFCLMQWLLRT